MGRPAMLSRPLLRSPAQEPPASLTTSFPSADSSVSMRWSVLAIGCEVAWCFGVEQRSASATVAPSAMGRRCLSCQHSYRGHSDGTNSVAPRGLATTARSRPKRLAAKCRGPLPKERASLSPAFRGKVALAMNADLCAADAANCVQATRPDGLPTRRSREALRRDQLGGALTLLPGVSTGCSTRPNVVPAPGKIRRSLLFAEVGNRRSVGT